VANHLGQNGVVTLFAIGWVVCSQLDLAAMAADDCDFDRALKLTERATADEQRQAFVRARLLIQLHRGKEALEAIDRIPTGSPLFERGERSLLRAMALAEARRFDEALRVLDASEAEGGDVGLIEGNRARIEIDLRRFPEAEKRLRRLLVKESPRALTSAVYNFACLRSLQGHQVEALGLVGAAVQLGFGSQEILTDPDLADLRRAFPTELAALARRTPERCTTW
jgi:tetratricopeptide (TPR) repeat protein